jgi:trk system potassium uptake protein TrkA
MHFIIVGAGRVGRLLTERILEKDHTLSLVSNDAQLLDLMPDHENMKKIKGFAFDLDVLKRAGADEAFGLAAVTDDDNLNVLATRIARNNFNVEKVVVRVYDQSKAHIFERFGIPTVSTIHWTVDQVLREMIPIGADVEFIEKTSNIILSQIDYDDSWDNHKIGEIEAILGVRIGFIVRFGESFIPTNNDYVQNGDRIHVLVRTDEVDKVAKKLSKRYELAVNPNGDQN